MNTKPKAKYRVSHTQPSQEGVPFARAHNTTSNHQNRFFFAHRQRSPCAHNKSQIMLSILTIPCIATCQLLTAVAVHKSKQYRRSNLPAPTLVRLDPASSTVPRRRSWSQPRCSRQTPRPNGAFALRSPSPCSPFSRSLLSVPSLELVEERRPGTMRLPLYRGSEELIGRSVC